MLPERAEDSRNREALVAQLERYGAGGGNVAGHERERAVAAELVRFVRSDERCFQRELSHGHVTGSAWVVDRELRHALLTHHRKLGKWLQLGGHADGDSDVRRVALREAVEESGLSGIVPVSDSIYDVDIHEIPARGSEPAHLHYDVRFAFFADSTQQPVASDESHAVAWVPLDRIPALGVDESVLRLIAKTESLRS